MSDLKGDLRAVDSAISQCKDNITKLNVDLKHYQSELVRLQRERCLITGDKMCVYGDGVATHKCYECGSHICYECVGYCNEEEMVATCNNLQACYMNAKS